MAEVIIVIRCDDSDKKGFSLTAKGDLIRSFIKHVSSNPSCLEADFLNGYEGGSWYYNPKTGIEGLDDTTGHAYIKCHIHSRATMTQVEFNQQYGDIHMDDGDHEPLCSQGSLGQKLTRTWDDVTCPDCSNEKGEMFPRDINGNTVGSWKVE